MDLQHDGQGDAFRGGIPGGGNHLHRLLVWRRSTRFVSVGGMTSAAPVSHTRSRNGMGGGPGSVRSALIKYIHEVH